uniref:Mutator family transposase n=1 Tax=Steinernema glaseri TaxID=37863 RepID=A0A1I8AQ12_9BILA
MDRVCATFYEDVVGLLNSLREDFKTLQELSGRWGTVAKRHEKKRVVYYFTMIQDRDTNAWNCYRGTPHHTNKEVSESDLFSVILPFVSSRLRHSSSFKLFTKYLSQEDAARILRIFKGKAQLLDITWPN